MRFKGLERLALMGALLGAAPAFASASFGYYVNFTGGIEAMKTSNYASALTSNGFSAPAGTATTASTRLGNESPSGSLRLAFEALHALTYRQTQGGNYASVDDNRFGGLFQIGLFPTSYVGVTFGAQLGIGESLLTIINGSSSGILSDIYFFLEPFVGAELKLGEGYRLYVEGGYSFPFSTTARNYAATLSPTKISGSGYTIKGGLIFYFGK